MDAAVKDYLESDRQWTRELRIANARWHLAQATEDADREFWTAVLHALDAKAS